MSVILKRLGGGCVLDARYHRDDFGVGYVHAMAAAIGLVVHRYDVESAGIDLGIRLGGRTNRTMSPGIDVRVLAWAEFRQVGFNWEFDGLTETQFNLLAGSDFLYPRYLFLVSLPEHRREYANVRSDGMMLRQLGYYRAMAEDRRISNPDMSRARTVRIPLSNTLTDRSLQELTAIDS